MQGLRIGAILAAANDGDLRADILNIAPPRFCKRMYEKFARVNDRVVNYMALVDLYHHTLPHAKELPPFGYVLTLVFGFVIFSRVAYTASRSSSRR